MITIGNTKIPRDTNRFPDGTLALGEIDWDEEWSEEYGWIGITWNYEGDDELFTLMCVRDYLPKDINVTLTMPYIPHARMDRVENEEVFTLKTFCSIINSLNFNQVYVLDPHSNVSIALLDRVHVMPVRPYIKDAIQKIGVENPLLFFPDEGAMKRYSKLFPDRDYTFGFKTRNDGKVQDLKLAEPYKVKDKNILIVDDICSYGGTFLKSAQKLKTAGANNIYLYITHCEENIYRGDLLKSGLIERVYTTNTIMHNPKENITIVYGHI